MEEKGRRNTPNTAPALGKWFYAFVVVAALLLGAIVTIIILATGAKEQPEIPSYDEGDETGIYYYDAALGEYTLTLNSGNKFTIAGPDLNKSGEYTFAENVITLDFFRDEDGTAQATLEGDTLKLAYRDATMNFLKKVPYTVTFSTNGGSAVDTVTVINGKTVNKPNDPTKDGNVFLGWYADAEFTKAFFFGVTPVFENTTVYAKWAATVAGQDEFVIDFDLGYDAMSPAPISTVGGKLVFDADYTEPTREGYTFVGWYISAYEDGNKLTYAATENVELDANTTLFAVWSDNSASKLQTPAVSVVGNTITWNAVEGATAYKVTISDAEGNILFDRSVGTTTQSYDFASADPGDYQIQVVATGSSTADSDAAVRFYQNKGLGRVSKFEIIGTTLVYNAVENAEKYLITIDCGNKEHNHTLFDNSNSTNFNFANCTMQPGGIGFTVTAVANGYASTVSETFYYVKNLDKVGEIVFDAKTASFKWASVANAGKYYVTVNCSKHNHATVDNGTSTSFDVRGCSGDVTISVVPASAGFNSPEATVTQIKKTTPATPTNISVSDMTVTWDAAEGAKSYVIKVNGTSYNVNGTSYDLASSGIVFTAGSKHTISVQSVGETENSLMSDTIEVSYLTMGTVTYGKNTVSWTPVVGATKFEVRVNGGESFTVSNVNSANVVLTKAGINLVEVRPAGFANATEWSSVEVYAYEVVYETRSMNGSAVEYVAKGDTMMLPTDFVYAGFNFGGWYNTPGAAAGNGAAYDDVVFNGTGSMTLYANWVPKSYNIEFVGIDGTMQGAATGDKHDVTYTKDFKLPVMTTTDPVRSNFAGWYTGPGGSGTKLTDYLGNSVVPYGVTTDSKAYPYFTSGLVFELKNDNTYAVKKGADIDTIPVVTIPAYYNDIPVTTILENGFYNCDRLVEIYIPDTIRLIGTGAFSSCDALVAFNVYEVETQTPHEVFYQSDNGALLYNDVASGYTYLEVFPRAKKGAYTIPETVDVIRNRAFNYAKVSSLTISKDVLIIGDYAFSNCRLLKEVIFEEGGMSPVSVATNAFYGCYATTYVKLPALIKGSNENDAFDIATLDYFTALETIEVEKVTGAYFSSVEGMLCNELGDKILYCPKAYAGISGVLTIPKGITAIGEKTFSGRSVFTEIIIPNYVTEIGASAFNGCRNVVKITIEGSRSRNLEIGTNAFYGCSGAREVIFKGNGTNAVDAGATTIGSAAFSGMSEIRTLTIENGANIAKIGSAAFASNLKLRTISIGDKATVTEIGAAAFKGCEALTVFTIPATTVAIGDSAFADCSFISKIIFAPNGQNINFGSYVFQNCVSLASVELPATVQRFDGSAFDGCYSLQTILVDPSNAYLTTINGVLYDKNITEIMFYPKGIDDPTLANLPWNTLTTIGDTVFKDNTNITSISIPKNVTKIGDSAFNGCVNLSSVTFAADSTALTVGAYAFANCQNLHGINLPAATTSLGEGAFYVTPLAEFTIPSSVATIGAKAFMYTTLKTINIPASVTLIGDGAFAYTNLESVTIEGGNNALILGDKTDIDISYNFESLDYNTKKAAKLFPNDYIGIYGTGVFTGTALQTIHLPARVTTIGAFAFYNMTSLTSVTIDENSNLTTIGDAAFYGAGVTSMPLENTKLATVGEFAFTEAKLKSLKFPNTIALIEKYAFADMGTISGTKFTPSLTALEFATGGTTQLTINDSAFKNSAFTTVTFPANLTVCSQRILVGSNDPTYGVYMSSFFTILEGNVKLTEVKVDAANELYCSIDGVFYQKDTNGKPGTLVFCPPAKTGEYIVPNTVTYVEYRAFYLSQLSKLTFANLETTDANYCKPVLEIGSGDTSNGLGQYVIIGGSASNGTQLTRSMLAGYNDAVTTRVYNTQVIKTCKIAELNFPSHLKTIASWAIRSLDSSEVVINFDQNSSPIELRKYAINYNKGLKVLHLPKVASLSTGDWYDYSLGNNENLTEITFAEGSTLTAIPNRTFSGNKKMTSFEIPASVTYIGEAAFDGLSNMTSVTFAPGSKIATIESEAFARTNLTEFVFPDTVTYVGEEIFLGCKQLKKVTIGTGITSLIASDPNGNGSSVFRGNYSIEEYAVAPGHPTLMVEDGVIYDIAKTFVFAYPPTKNPSTYTMPATVKEIANFAFYQFPGTTIELSPNLTKIGYGAFYESKLKSINIPATVTVIDGYAFYGQSSYRYLTSVTFAENSQLTIIGNQAFMYSGLSTIDLPDNVTTIGYSSFSSNTKLKNVIMPSALTMIDTTAFSGCTALETVKFQNNLDSIGHQSFYNCKKLTNIELPASVTFVSNYAFANCSGLETLTFAEGSRLTTVGYFAFSGCSSLKALAFPEGVSSIGLRAFDGCTSLELVDMSKTQFTILESNLSSEEYWGFFNGCSALKTVLLPETLEIIDTRCFAGCTALESIVIPATVNTIRERAFDGCSNLASVVFAEGSVLKNLGSNPKTLSAIFRGTTSLTSVKLPENLETLGASVFENSGLTSITFPESLNVISVAAFKDCVNLTEVNIPSNIVDVHDQAFMNCVNIEKLTLADGIEYLGSDAFGNCAKIKEIVVPATVLRMGGNPFANCTGLTSFQLAQGSESFVIDATGVLYDVNKRTVIFYPSYVTNESYTMPNTVFELATSAFAGSQLKSIVISDNIKVIPDGCFKGSTLLESVTIPLSVLSIGNEAFRNCASLDNVVIPASCTYIGDYAFEYCTSLKNFDFGKRNTSLTVGVSLFRGCTSFVDVILPDGLTAIPEYMFAGTGVKNLVIPESVQDLSGTGLFMECLALESIEFPESYKGAIGALAFYGCVKLKSVTLPDGVTKLGDNDWKTDDATFKNCTSLQTVNFGSGVSDLGANAFENCTSLKVVDMSDTGLWALGNYVFKNCTSLETVVLSPDCYDLGSNTFEGCTALTGRIDVPYFWFYGGFFKDCVNIKEIHLAEYGDWFDNWDPVTGDWGVNGNFEGLTSNTSVYFDSWSWEDLADGELGFFDEDPEYFPMLNSQARVFDCDGNEIFYDGESCVVLKVVSPDGEVLYEA